MTPDDRDDRDDFDDRPRRRRARPTSSGGRTWLILVGVGCVVVFGCGGLIAAGVVWGFRAFGTDLPAASAAASAFLDHLQRGQPDNAYAAASDGFRSRQTAEQFRAFVGRFETLTTHTSRNTNGFRLFANPGGKQAFIQVTLHAPNNAMTCTLMLVDEGGTWRVDSITVP